MNWIKSNDQHNEWLQNYTVCTIVVYYVNSCLFCLLLKCVMSNTLFPQFGVLYRFEGFSFHRHISVRLTLFGLNGCGTPVLVAEFPSRNLWSLLIFVRYLQIYVRNFSILVTFLGCCWFVNLVKVLLLFAYSTDLKRRVFAFGNIYLSQRAL